MEDSIDSLNNETYEISIPMSKRFKTSHMISQTMDCNGVNYQDDQLSNIIVRRKQYSHDQKIAALEFVYHEKHRGLSHCEAVRLLNSIEGFEKVSRKMVNEWYIFNLYPIICQLSDSTILQETRFKCNQDAWA